MNTFYRNSEIKGGRMCVMRVIVRYRRAIDGREFSSKKAYIIAGGGSALMDHDLRGLDEGTPMRFSEVKSALGIE